MNEHSSGGLDLRYYIAVLRRRFWLLAIPFVLVLTVGSGVVLHMRPIFLAEGRILVESQQIPTELVRSTVTASAKERIQVIEQRVMTRDNLLAIAEKFKLFADKRQTLSTTELLDLMRSRTRMQPFELDTTRRRGDALTIALQVAFEYEEPQPAMRVANELMTLILSEDARNRASRAHETTGFLTKELKRLESELAAVEVQMLDYKRRNTVDPVTEKMALQYSTLKAEYQEKTTLYSERHPDILRLKRQLSAMEETIKRGGQVENGLDILQNNRATIQRNIESTTQKVAAARLGESLETGQFAEKLQVLENAIVPQRPVKPNRPKWLAFVFGLALLAGTGAVVLMEVFNATIREPRDLFEVVDARLLVAIPYIVTARERSRQKIKYALSTSLAATTGLGAIASLHVFWRPVDEIWSALVTRLLG